MLASSRFYGFTDFLINVQVSGRLRHQYAREKRPIFALLITPASAFQSVGANIGTDGRNAKDALVSIASGGGVSAQKLGNVIICQAIRKLSAFLSTNHATGRVKFLPSIGCLRRPFCPTRYRTSDGPKPRRVELVRRRAAGQLGYTATRERQG